MPFDAPNLLADQRLGTLLVRSLERPQRILSAMKCRGFDARLCLLHEALADYGLDFLEGRILAIRILDPEIRLRFTLAGGRIHSADAGLPDVTITAAADDPLLVAHRADPDSLFFHRRLRIASVASVLGRVTSPRGSVATASSRAVGS